MKSLLLIKIYDSLKKWAKQAGYTLVLTDTESYQDLDVELPDGKIYRIKVVRVN